MKGYRKNRRPKWIIRLLVTLAIALDPGLRSSHFSTDALVSKMLPQITKKFRGRDPILITHPSKFHHSFHPRLVPPSTCWSKLGVSKDGASISNISVDPIVVRVINDEREKDEIDNEESGDESLMESLRRIDSGILESSRGLAVWRRALAKGRSPIECDFDSKLIWPPPPLFSCLVEVMSSLQLPRLALRHPETIPMILRSVMRHTIDYARRRTDEKKNFESCDSEDDDEESNDDSDLYFYDFDEHVENDVGDDSFLSELEFPRDDSEIAREVVEGLIEEWNGVVQGVSLLDDIFGFDHNLLSSDEEDTDDDSASGATMGFGTQDGIWSHTGWRMIPALQKQISDIPELQNLMQELGRRPSAEEDSSCRRLEKFAPRKQNPDGALGAEFDPRLRRESVTGIALSGNLSEMLPSEAVLLRQKLGENQNETTSSTILRQLFLAKMAESKLQSYQLSGWADVPSIQRKNPLYMNRLPSAPGGPIIVCLDTSWSMSGNRESLSKAVVLACVSEAHRQGRDCQVVSFSTARNVIESGVITADANGIRRLLEFLSCSFGGGTDVTGALKFAINALNNDGNENPVDSGNISMEAADILLVTDGEIQDPPVPEEVMLSIERLKYLKGVEIHGLLIGKAESKPLSRLCTHTHDFLSRYTLPAEISPVGQATKKMSLNSIRRNGRNSVTMLYAKRSYYDEFDDDVYNRKGRNRKKGNRKWDRYDEESDAEIDLWSRTIDETVEDTKDVNIERMDELVQEDESEFAQGIDTAREKEFTMLKQAAADSISGDVWTPEMLDEERNKNNNCWNAHENLNAAVARVEDGLIERGEDSRLVVLAMISSEHILLLGKPGTGKSVLGLRLAKLCDGIFFQRLLTRFTTPEELFGPLSLKSLENDEYRRVTSGFLPTADIAFLDEIFKANSAILNTLLTILNERKYDNGGKREKCPIRCVVGASNELPDSDELVALYDRFLIRKEIVRVSDDGVMKLLSLSNPGESSCELNDNENCAVPFVDNLDGIIESLSSACDSILMDDDACELMRDIRTFLRENHNIEISDRRLVKAARLLKISAASDGREKVDTLDFLLLQHCFWNEPSQRLIIREWLWDNLTPSGRSTNVSPNQMRFLLDNLRKEILITLKKTNGYIDDTFGVKQNEISTLEALREESKRIATIAVQRLDALARHMELVRRSDEFIWIQPDDASAMKQLLLPQAELLWPQVKQVAEDAKALEMAISTENSLTLSNDHRADIIELLWEDGASSIRDFTEDELQLSRREAKSKYDSETLRAWKKAKKKYDKASK